MNELYPLKFKPIFKDKIWGGQKIKTVLGMDFAPLPNCGEAWTLSGYGEDISVVSNGFLAGNQLDELIEVYMGDLVGEMVYEKHGNIFPLLIKILDSNDWLSVQVHPDDDMAARVHGGQGKTEMWYVAGADAGAELISGFKNKITPEVYVSHLQNDTLTEILNYENVKQGDVFFTPSGRIHSLGPGLLIFEIQQTSDLTYRIYDFGRKDSEGRHRELHTDLALEAINFEMTGSAKVGYTKTRNQTVPVVDCDYFKTSLIHFDEPVVKDFSGFDSFILFQAVEGRCKVQSPQHSELLTAGEVILIPAVMEQVTIIPQGEAKLFEIYVP